MLRCGEICKDCGIDCHKDPNFLLTIECPLCNGIGCDDCHDGNWFPEDCPKKMIGEEMTVAANYYNLAEKGFLPEEGGLLRQSQWFIDIMLMFQSEQARIDTLHLERING